MKYLDTCIVFFFKLIQKNIIIIKDFHSLGIQIYNKSSIFIVIKIYHTDGVVMWTRFNMNLSVDLNFH